MPDSAAPIVVDRGPGDPAVAVVAGIHGDEPSGVRAVRTLLADDPAFRRGVRFVLANPPAFLANDRFLDADLNRVFPGDPESPDRERRFAAALCELTAGLPTLSLHATHSQPDPMALVDLADEVAELAARLPVPSVVDETAAVAGAFTDCSAVVTVEAGCQHSQEAAETALEQTRAFLQQVDALPGEPPAADPMFYRLGEPVEKPPDVEYELRVENFEAVPAGTTYATAGEDAFVADRSFVPILMSECGYDEIFGYRGTRLGDSLAAARREAGVAATGSPAGERQR